MRSVERLISGEGPYLQDYVDGAVAQPYLDTARRHGFTTFAMLPVSVDDALEAMIVLYFKRRPELAQPARTLQAIARTASISLANFRTREHLAGSEARYRALFEYSPDAILLVRPGKALLAANRAALELYRTDFAGLSTFLASEAGREYEAAMLRRIGTLPADGRTSFNGKGLRPDGTIERGAQNLPGDWESEEFNLPERVVRAVPRIRGEDTAVTLHNDAVVQGLSEACFLRDTATWGVLTVGTGLGNAHFTNRERAGGSAYLQGERP